MDNNMENYVSPTFWGQTVRKDCMAAENVQGLEDINICLEAN